MVAPAAGDMMLGMQLQECAICGTLGLLSQWLALQKLCCRAAAAIINCTAAQHWLLCTSSIMSLGCGLCHYQQHMPYVVLSVKHLWVE